MLFRLSHHRGGWLCKILRGSGTLLSMKRSTGGDTMGQGYEVSPQKRQNSMFHWLSQNWMPLIRNPAQKDFWKMMNYLFSLRFDIFASTGNLHRKKEIIVGHTWSWFLLMAENVSHCGVEFAF